jgi:hypothetical protein
MSQIRLWRTSSETTERSPHLARWSTMRKTLCSVPFSRRWRICSAKPSFATLAFPKYMVPSRLSVTLMASWRSAAGMGVAQWEMYRSHIKPRWGGACIVKTTNKTSTQPSMDCAKADELTLENNVYRLRPNLRFRTRNCRHESIVNPPVSLWLLDTGDGRVVPG